MRTEDDGFPEVRALIRPDLDNEYDMEQEARMRIFERGERPDNRYSDFADVARELGISTIEARRIADDYRSINDGLRVLSGGTLEDVEAILSDGRNEIPAVHEGRNTYISRLGLKLLKARHGIDARFFASAGTRQ